MVTTRNRNKGGTTTPASSTTKKATKTKHTKKEKSSTPKNNNKSETKEEADATTNTGIVVSIEACKQWNAFKTRALKVQKAVGSKATVKINESKPGKGNFIIKVGENTVIELLGLKRPFPPLKALDMDDVNEQVLNAIDEEAGGK